MITIRQAGQRGHEDHGWLSTFHTFSFADYYDPAHMGFGNLRVINEDFVQPGEGFPEHSHRDMEILTCVLEGSIKHRDSTGVAAVIRPGELQRMTAGTGVTHSEMNASAVEPLHFLQIWILPSRRGLPPGYEQGHPPAELVTGRFGLVASPDSARGALVLNADARVYRARLDDGVSASQALAPGRRAWLQVARGSVVLGEHTLKAGDGAGMTDEPVVAIRSAARGSEVLMFDLA